MAQDTNIEWCDHTINFWSGCTKVSPACNHCYAETMAKRNPKTFGKWGSGKPRSPHLEGARASCFKWNKNVAAVCDRRTSRRPRVFVNSMSDWLDDEISHEWLAHLLETIRLCPNLDFLLLTKRPENFHKLLDRAQNPFGGTRSGGDPPDFVKWVLDWLDGSPPPNVWIGTTVENQECAATRIPLLLKIPARIRFLSCEPLLGPLDLSPLLVGDGSLLHVATNSRMAGIHWIICGGESGAHARPMHPDWARSLRDQCATAGVPFLFKQWGEYLPICEDPPNWIPMPDGQDWHTGKKSIVVQLDGSHRKEFPPGAMTCIRLGKKHTGRLLDGALHHAFPV
jgi:protein gp37